MKKLYSTLPIVTILVYLQSNYTLSFNPLSHQVATYASPPWQPNNFSYKSFHRLAQKNEEGLSPRTTITSSSSLSSSSSSSSSSPLTSNSEKATQTKPAMIAIMNAALLISGTTIGGGFLALPTVTSTIGFIPSSITLFGVWLYFLFQSFILVETIQFDREKGALQEQLPEGDESLINTSTTTIPTVSSVVRNIFGESGEILIGLLLTILIEATLVSQISRAGLMFNPSNYKFGCAISSIAIAFLVFGPKRRGIQFASVINSYLTLGFLLSAFGVFSFGIPNANWDLLGFGIGSSSTSNTFLKSLSGISNVVPTFLQLLVYGEIVPCVCQILNYNTKAIRLAIATGSFLTLCLQIGWSGLGIALSPSSSAANDVVNFLLQQGGIVRIPLFCLAITAILTTILGSYLALLTMFNDIYVKLQMGGNNKREVSFTGDGDIDGEDDAKFIDRVDSTMEGKDCISLKQRFIVGSMITLPALSIASTSPLVFLKAIDFAGSYPVLLLWGVLPPVMALVQRKKKGSDIKLNHMYVDSSGPSSWLIFLISISMTMVGISAKNDILSYMGNKQ